MTARLLFLFAKEPRPGKVKTRLCPPLTPAQAARCQQAFLEDLLQRMAGLAARVVVCATPDHDAPRLEQLAAAAGAGLAWQGEGDLGQRMERVLANATGKGAAAVIIGSDSPDLPLAYVRDAFERLDEPGLVLGPSLDGGYYLVGCRGPVPSIFDLGPVWGGPLVFSLTVETLRRLGIEHHELPQWEDVDDAEGLRRLAARLRGSERSGGDRHMISCERLIAALAREGVAL